MQVQYPDPGKTENFGRNNIWKMDADQIIEIRLFNLFQSVRILHFASINDVLTVKVAAERDQLISVTGTVWIGDHQKRGCCSLTEDKRQYLNRNKSVAGITNFYRHNRVSRPVLAYSLVLGKWIPRIPTGRLKIYLLYKHKCFCILKQE